MSRATCAKLKMLLLCRQKTCQQCDCQHLRAVFIHEPMVHLSSSLLQQVTLVSVLDH